MYKAKKLPFLYYQLEPTLSTKTNAYHYERHYRTYLNNLNKIILKNNISTNYELTDLYNHLDIINDEDKNDFLFNLGGVVNHDLYFESIKPGKEKPNTKLLSAINKSFGSIDNMYNEIEEYAKELKGSGYLFLVTDSNKLSLLITTNQDSPYLYGLIPLLCIDLWEHAYYLEYQNERNRYVEEILKILNFSYANNLFSKLT